MNIEKMSREELLYSKKYATLTDEHLLISISEPGEDEVIPPVHSRRKSLLRLSFNDVSNISKISDSKYTLFDSGMAREVLDTLDNAITKNIKSIIVQCKAGISRSVALAAAIAKIVNNCDDAIFTNGAPNMLVYTTILNTYFDTEHYDKKWPNIWLVRKRALELTLGAAHARIAILRTEQAK